MNRATGISCGSGPTHRSAPTAAQIALCALLAVLFLGVAWQTQTTQAAQSTLTGPGQAISNSPASGNYCLTCHTPGDPRLENPTAWRGTIEVAGLTPCPAMKTVGEELYYTERLLLAIDNARAKLPDNAQTAALDARLAGMTEGYSRLLDAPVNSLEAFVAEAQAQRYQFGKIYTQLNQLDDARKRQNVLIFAGLATLLVLLSLGWGMYNTRHAGHPGAGKRGLDFYAWRVVILLLIFGFFVLPLFRQTSVTQASTEEALAIQTALDTAQRTARAADQADARAWMLARAGATYQPLDAAQAEAAVQEAQLAARDNALNSQSLWGEAAAAREAAIGEAIFYEKAGLTESQIEAVRSRAWSLRLAAQDWLAVDPQVAAGFLTQAEEAASASQGIYHDLDLRGIAVAWAGLDAGRATQIAGQIGDPALRAWALAETAQASGDTKLYAKAAEAALQVSDPLRRAQALQGVARLSGDQGLYAQAAAALDETSGAAQAYGLAALAGATGQAALAEKIDTAYPAARALALLNAGQFEAAWQAASGIADPYEQARARQAILSAWASQDSAQAVEFAPQIAIPALRERTLRDVIGYSGNASLVESLKIPYYQVQALTALGQYPAAWEATAKLKETYPLVALGLTWGKDDPAAVLQLVDRMGREADKSIVLNALASQSNDRALFERALGMALAARVRYDVLAPAEASRQLGQALLTWNPDWAREALDQAVSTAGGQ